MIFILIDKGLSISNFIRLLGLYLECFNIKVLLVGRILFLINNL